MNDTKLSEQFEEHAAKYMIVLNPDKERVKWIVERLLVNDEKYGQRLCPCRPPSLLSKA